MCSSSAPFYKAAGGGGGAAYTYQGAFTTTPGSVVTVVQMPFDIGAAQADRLLVFWTGIGSGTSTIVSVIVDPAGANVTLTLDASSATVASSMFSGVVATGSGTVNIQVTYTTTVQFLNISAHLWRLTGMTSNVKQTSAAGQFNGGTTISVTAPCFLFTGVMYNSNGVAPTWATSTVVPSNINTDSATKSYAADWIIVATNASFSDNPKTATFNNLAAVTYH